MPARPEVCPAAEGVCLTACCWGTKGAASALTLLLPGSPVPCCWAGAGLLLLLPLMVRLMLPARAGC